MRTLILFFSLFSFSLAAKTINLNPNNHVVFNNVVSGNSVSKAIQDLAALETNEEAEIYLFLDTPGGSVFAGFDLIQYLNGYKKPVHTITSFAASMGFQIVQNNRGHRYILSTGTLMSHPMSGGLIGEIGQGLQIDNRHKNLKEIIQFMDTIVVERTKGKQTLESYVKAYDNELWISGNTAVEAGYADEIVDINIDALLQTQTYTTYKRTPLINTFVLEIEVEYSKSPLISSPVTYTVTIVELITSKKLIMLTNKNPLNLVQNDSSKVTNALNIEDITQKLNQNVDYNGLLFRLTRDKQYVRKLNNL